MSQDIRTVLAGVIQLAIVTVCLGGPLVYHDHLRGRDVAHRGPGLSSVLRPSTAAQDEIVEPVPALPVTAAPTPEASTHPAAAAAPAPAPVPAPLATSGFLGVQGKVLTYGGQTVWLRGENFNNEPGLKCCGGPDISKINVNAADYAHVHDLGLNHVRFGLDYDWYRTDRTRFFQVVDQHVAWAKQNHLWMIPVMFMPPGGSDGGYGGQTGFWDSPANQQLLIDFWVDFSHHYASQTTIAGYDVFNEPAPRTGQAWQGWAQRVSDAIREADVNHFVVLEADSADWNLPPVSGSRIVWSGHCYALVGADGCNYPGPDPHKPPARPFLMGEVGSKHSQGIAFVGPNLARFAGDQVSWTHFVIREPAGFGLFNNNSPGDFSNPWMEMIETVRAGSTGAVKPP